MRYVFTISKQIFQSNVIFHAILRVAPRRVALKGDLEVANQLRSLKTGSSWER